MTEKRLNISTNLFFFFVFIPLLTLLVPAVRWAETRPALLISLTAFLIIEYLGLVRANIPGLFIRKHYIRGSVYAIIAFGATYAYTWAANWFGIYGVNGHYSSQAILLNQTVWFLFLVILGYSFFNNMLRESARLASSREEIEAQRDKAELAMYKAQINPHFLFNTLNTLYGLILTDSDKREEAFEKFINMCKYTYNNATRDYIPLEEERDYIQEYVDLQLLRLGGMTKVNFVCSIDNPEARIAPMLLITFVENAFKYGISSTEESVININLTVRKGILRLNVYNSHIKEKVKVSSRKGVQNVKKRLDLLYPDRYTLRQKKDKDGFTVRLYIKLT